MPTAKALESVDRIRTLREGAGKSMEDFTVLAALLDAVSIEDYARARAGGITHVLTMPWMFYSGRNATTAEQIRGMEKFSIDIGFY
ncbi:hypothetical protein GORHZ_186_00480 [Gordonia rhizosphera NBRC 16068]|uniref:Uncharacterized protein n=1 Tax=Gordonia rhizosphera NBRC 16068 TaxID=1108045 RepID=K6WKJ1_9ACTN|nr:hypothetical protein GORHZ_186_00480 [Gordonia rhizosphera NBRC 16068]